MNKFDYTILIFTIYKILQTSSLLTLISIFTYYKYLDIYKNCFTPLEKIIISYAFEHSCLENKKMLNVVQYHLINESIANKFLKINFYDLLPNKENINKKYKINIAFYFLINIFIEYVNNCIYFGITLNDIRFYINSCLMNIHSIIYWIILCFVFFIVQLFLKDNDTLEDTKNELENTKNTKDGKNIKNELENTKNTKDGKNIKNELENSKNGKNTKNKLENTKNELENTKNTYNSDGVNGAVKNFKNKIYNTLQEKYKNKKYFCKDNCLLNDKILLKDNLLNSINDRNFKRKLFHFLFFFLFCKKRNYFVRSTILILGYTFLFLEKKLNLKNFYKGLINEKDPGNFVMSHIILLVVTYFILNCDEHICLLISICVVDSVASIAGLKIKNWKKEVYFDQKDYVNFDKCKTFEGSFCGFIMGNLVHFIIYRNYNYFDFYFVVSFVEFFTSQNDNIVVPFIGFEYLKFRNKVIL
ncbi:hypothetical protein DMUE_2229 [Dictyocoela muelleri]|nr:hypothetical protein DMUE_2229 [Dictyocoela muelleri]